MREGNGGGGGGRNWNVAARNLGVLVYIDTLLLLFFVVVYFCCCCVVVVVCFSHKGREGRVSK